MTDSVFVGAGVEGGVASAHDLRAACLDLLGSDGSRAVTGSHRDDRAGAVSSPAARPAGAGPRGSAPGEGAPAAVLDRLGLVARSMMARNTATSRAMTTLRAFGTQVLARAAIVGARVRSAVAPGRPLDAVEAVLLGMGSGAMAQSRGGLSALAALVLVHLFVVPAFGLRSR